MEEIKSIFQIPVTKDYVDLHYLIRISNPSIESYGSPCGIHFISIDLFYMLSKEKITIKICCHDLFLNNEWSNLGNNWKEKVLKRFEERIRQPLVHSWEQYRKHIVQ